VDRTLALSSFDVHERDRDSVTQPQCFACLSDSCYRRTAQLRLSWKTGVPSADSRRAVPEYYRRNDSDAMCGTGMLCAFKSKSVAMQCHVCTGMLCTFKSKSVGHCKIWLPTILTQLILRKKLVCLFILRKQASRQRMPKKVIYTRLHRDSSGYHVSIVIRPWIRLQLFKLP
jgi:hypothetical protein